MFKHIIIASDLSLKSKIAAQKAVQIAHQFNSKIFLLNVHEEFMDKDGLYAHLYNMNFQSIEDL